MATLTQAPLVEVAAQIRWGINLPSADERIAYTFTTDEQTSFPRAFEQILRPEGFTYSEHIDPALDDVQFAISKRFRRAPDAWPVFQIGLGVLSVHQANESYSWGKFKNDVLRGVELLKGALSDIYPESVPFIGVELMYVDAFFLEEGETPGKFLRNKLNVQLAPAPDFLDAPFVKPTLTSASLSLQLDLTDPEATLILSLDHGDIFGRAGFLMDTRVRSVGTPLDYSARGLNDWLEAAHRVQQHTFQTLIKPAYLKSFQ